MAMEWRHTQMEELRMLRVVLPDVLIMAEYVAYFHYGSEDV